MIRRARHIIKGCGMNAWMHEALIGQNWEVAAHNGKLVNPEGLVWDEKFPEHPMILRVVL